MSTVAKTVTPSEALLAAVAVMREYGLEKSAINVIWKKDETYAEITISADAFCKFASKHYARTEELPTYRNVGPGHTLATIVVDGCVIKAFD